MDKKIAILTDTNSGITPEQAVRYGIYLVSMPVIIDDETYFENESISQDEFFQRLREDACVSTSQPAPGVLMDCWEGLLERYDEIIYLPMSSGLSGSCQTAAMLAEEYDGSVHVVDNHRISVTLRQSALEAKHLADQGKTVQEIVAHLEQDGLEASIYVAVNTLEYLKKSGRVTAAGAAIGTILNLKPVLQIQGGKLDAYRKARGMRQAMQVSSVIPMEGFDPTQGVGLKAQISTLIAAMPEGNLTMQAMKRYFKTPLKKDAEAVFPFSSTYKYCAIVFSDDAYVLGAPEFVLRSDYEKYRPLIESYSADGFRTVLFGRYEGVPDGQALTEPVIPMGLILLTNPIRRDAPETFRYFAQQGVAIKVISGDNPLTVSQIAAEAGIPGAENYVDASTLETEEALRTGAEQYTVFGRVTPEQKRLLVRALQSAGHTVGMTGDGVNDVLALKEADCSVAMASGCDAAAQVSQLVLLESDFASMPSAVMEGRRVVNNIERSASLFLVKNIFSFLMAVFSVCFRITYPLEPSQISLISMFTIGIPGFFLALQPNGDIIHGRFLSNVLIKALPAGLTDFLVVGALVVFGSVFGVNETDISTACTMLLAIVGFMILYHISKPLNPLRWCVWVGCIVGLLVCSIWLGDVFGIEHMSMECVMLFVLFAIVTEPTLRYGTILVEKIGGIITKRAKK